MATFLAGLTDEILPPLLYKPDYNLQFNELNIGTQKYKLYKDQLESLWADYFNSPLTNPNNILERESIKKDVEEKLTKFAGLNFADIKVNEGIKSLINTISSKRHIINDIAFTKRVGEYATTLDLLKLSPGTKENNYLTYNPDQRKELERQVREFANLKDKNEIAGYKFRDPIYKNYDRIIGDYIKDYDAKIVTADVVPEYDESGKVVTYKDGYGRDIPINLLVETKNGKMTLPEWQQMIKDHLMKYHGYGEYLSWKTDLDIDSGLINNGVDVHALNTNEKNKYRFNKLLEKINEEDGVRVQYNLVVDNYNTIYDALQKRKERLYYEMNSQLNFNTLTSLKKDTFFDYEKRKILKEEYENVNKNLTIIGNIIEDIKSNKNLAEKINKGQLTNISYDNLKALYIEMMSTIDTDRMASNWINTHYEQKVKESEASIKALGNRPPSSSSSKVTPTESIEKHGQYTNDNSGINLVASGSKIELSEGALEFVKNDYITINKLDENKQIEPFTDNIFNWSKIFGVNELEGKSDEAVLSLINVSSEHAHSPSKSGKPLTKDVDNFILFSKDKNGNVEIKPIGVVKAFVKSDIKKQTENKVSYVEFTAPRNNTVIDKPLVNDFNKNPTESEYGPKLTIKDDVILYNSTQHTANKESSNFVKVQVGNKVYSILASELLSEPSEAYKDLSNGLLLVKIYDGTSQTPYNAVVKDNGLKKEILDKNPGKEATIYPGTKAIIIDGRKVEYENLNEKYQVLFKYTINNKTTK
jgi:hypothetical protein